MMFSCPELTSREAMVDGRLKKKYTKFEEEKKAKDSGDIFTVFLCFLNAHPISCALCSKDCCTGN